MANLSKLKRDEMIAFLEQLKQEHTDDASIRAFNEIKNHLLEKKYGLVWEEHSEEVDEMLKENIPVLTADPERRLCKDENLPWNFIIEGDNLQALYLLEKTHRGKIDCIYIDPPYNTGATDWKYNNNYVDNNDTYRHSKWLSMMHKRLMIAKSVLSDDGALICAIDENEMQTIGLMLKDIFPVNNIDCIAVIHNPGGIQGANFSYCHEYAYFVYPKKSHYIGKEKRNDSEELTPFRDWGKENSKREGARNCFYPIILDIKTNTVIATGEVPADDFHPTSPNEIFGDKMYVWPIDVNGVERRWRFACDTVGTIIEELVPVNKRGIINIERRKQYFTRKTVWNNPLFSANNSGTQLIAKIIDNRFSFPKSLYLVKECLSACLQKKDAIVLDFFAGSGTTLNAVNLLNTEDGGNRTCIMVTNNEMSGEEEQQLIKLGIERGSSEWVHRGIARYVTWPRSKQSILGTKEDGSPIEGDYLTSNSITVEKKRNIQQVNFVRDLQTLSLQQIKQLVSSLTSGVIPKSMVDKGTKYVVSSEKKYSASILLDIDYAPQWVNELSGQLHITDLYIVTDNTKAFNNIKNSILEVMGNIYIREPLRIPMSNGFNANVKYFKCDWTPRKPEDYLLSNALCLHIREMIELQNAIEIDDVKNVLILNKSDFRNTILNPTVYDQIRNVWVNQNIVLNAEELKLLEAKGYKYIPKEFFGQELREAAE